MKQQPTRGGRRENSGRKSGPQGKRVKTAITMRPDQYETIKGNRSNAIEIALDFFEKAVKFVHVADDGTRYEGIATVTTERGFRPDVRIHLCDECDEHGNHVRPFYPYKEEGLTEEEKSLRAAIEQSAIEAQ